MKEVMRKGLSLLLFDFNNVITPRQFNDSSAVFNRLNHCLLIHNYWFKKVPLHFVATTFVALLIVAVINPAYLSSPAPLFISAVIAFLLLLLSLYIPLFTGIFLPGFYKTQDAKNHERFQELEKCRKVQLPNQTLVLIWYVLDKTAGIGSIKNDDAYTELLTQLYGVDQRSIKTAINLFCGSARKRNKLQGRARTEIENRFCEAYRFFESLDFEKAIPILKDLEVKCFSSLN